MPASPDEWIDAVVERHTRAFTASEFLKAVRALSVRYVERRRELAARSVLDSAGKRAAFAGFFAPLHYLTVRRVLEAIAGADAPVDQVLDLGCGTGVAAAAWSHDAGGHRPDVLGVDRAAWALEEARWNWHMLGLRARTRRQSLIDALVAAPTQPQTRRALVFAWSVNELPDAERARVLPKAIEAHERGARVLVLEPLARSAAPWWGEWAAPIVAAGGRVDEWKFPVTLPARLADLDHAAGFRRDHLSARSIWLPGVGTERTGRT